MRKSIAGEIAAELKNQQEELQQKVKREIDAQVETLSKAGAKKILIIEDSPLHQNAAKKQLGEYDLTILKSFSVFYLLMKRMELNLDSFDVVLTDVNLPSPRTMENNVEAATGPFVAFAALAAGVKSIGIISDLDSHSGEYGRAMGLLEGLCIQSEKAKMVFSGRLLESGEKDWAHLLKRLVSE